MNKQQNESKRTNLNNNEQLETYITKTTEKLQVKLESVTQLGTKNNQK